MAYLENGEDNAQDTDASGEQRWNLGGLLVGIEAVIEHDERED